MALYKALNNMNPPDNEAFIQELLDRNKAPVAVNTMAENRFMRVNKSWCELTGYQPEEVLGRTPQDLEIGIDPQNQSEMIQALLRQGCLEKLETLYKVKDGRKIHTQMSAKTISYQGEACVLADIAPVGEPIAPQKALGHEKWHVLNILNSLEEAYFETDLDGNITFFSDNLLDNMFGRTKEELLGMNFKEYTLCEDIQKVYHAYHVVYTGTSAVKCIGFGVVRKDGTLAYGETSVALLKDDTGRPIGFCGIAHDFNNILYAMIGFTELALEDSPQGTQLEENLKGVMVAGMRAKDLVRQILAFARQSEEKVDPVIVSIIVKEALQLIRSSIPATIEMETKIESDSRIMGNPTQVHQIIMNLCTNAAHAMEDMGGVLKVHLINTHIDEEQAKRHLNLASGNYLHLTVSDTGCGIGSDPFDTQESFFATA